MRELERGISVGGQVPNASSGHAFIMHEILYNVTTILNNVCMFFLGTRMQKLFLRHFHYYE